MKKYLEPTLKVCTFGTEDIIMDSGNITEASVDTNLGDTMTQEGYTFVGQGETTSISYGARFYLD